VTAQPRERLADAVAVLKGVDDVSDRLGKITTPTLVIHGEADQPVSYALGRILHDRIPGAQQLLTVPGADHTPPSPTLTRSTPPWRSSCATTPDHPRRPSQPRCNATHRNTTTTTPALKERPLPSTSVTDLVQLPFAFEEALNAGDVDAVLALFAPGVTMRTVTGQVISGPEALRAEVTGTVAAGGRLTNDPRRTLVAADTALIVVDWTMELTTADGARIAPSGTTANVARCSADGSWQFTVLNPRGTN
jgi:uncharacterized protein (TIGR02246 family)